MNSFFVPLDTGLSKWMPLGWFLSIFHLNSKLEQWMPADFRDDIVEFLENHLVHFPEVAAKKIFGHPGFSLGNRVFAFAYDDGLCLKLPRPLYETALTQEEIRPFMPGNDTKPMGTWVVISRPDAADYDADWELIETAMAYVMTEQGAPPQRKSSRKKKK